MDLVTLLGIIFGFILIVVGTFLAIDGFQKVRETKSRNDELDHLIMLSELEEEEFKN